jgi:acetyltransferase-like isoleucine patch superfamily enzyme
MTLFISQDVILGKNVRLSKFINLYGCSVGENTKIGAFVEVQKNAHIGKNCKISSHTFVCEGVVIEDEVFIGHGVTFINDTYPRATSRGRLQTEDDWTVEPTLVKKGASIGSGATILANVTIGQNAIIGAGSVVTADVPASAVVAGNPARVLRWVKDGEEIVSAPHRAYIPGDGRENPEGGPRTRPGGSGTDQQRGPIVRNNNSVAADRTID